MKKIKPKPKCWACGQRMQKFKSVKLTGVKIKGVTPVVCMDCVRKFGRPVEKAKEK